MNVHRAIPGVFVWLVSTIVFKLGPIESLFLWAPLGVVPLGLELIQVRSIVRPLQFSAALCAAASFHFAPGTRAALLAAPWALFCGALALWGAIRFLRRWGRFDPVETCIDAALILIAVGGWGLVMSRAGMKPAGFTEPIVLLTAVHFHYTGFAAPLLIGLAARHSGPRKPLLAAGAGVVAATPILAIGFTMRLPLLKLAAVSVIAASLILFAWELTRFAVDEPRGRTRALLGIAAFSIFWGMALAGLFAIGEFRERVIVDIPAMAWSHGILNGIGFATCGLLGARAWRP
jgi:hypothetical protein